MTVEELEENLKSRYWRLNNHCRFSWIEALAFAVIEKREYIALQEEIARRPYRDPWDRRRKK